LLLSESGRTRLEQGKKEEEKKRASVNFIKIKDNDLNFEKNIYFIGWVFIFLLMCFFFYCSSKISLFIYCFDKNMIFILELLFS